MKTDGWIRIGSGSNTSVIFVHDIDEFDFGATWAVTLSCWLLMVNIKHINKKKKTGNQLLSVARQVWQLLTKEVPGVHSGGNEDGCRWCFQGERQGVFPHT